MLNARGRTDVESRVGARQRKEGTMTSKNSKEAFEQAIEDGRLSTDKSVPNYAGNYMYMGTETKTGQGWRVRGRDLFKNIVTRLYDV
jgi:hypothetical protein